MIANTNYLSMKAAFAQNSTKNYVCVCKSTSEPESRHAVQLASPAFTHTHIHTHTHTLTHTHNQTLVHYNPYTCTGKEIDSGLIDSLHADVVKRNKSG